MKTSLMMFVRLATIAGAALVLFAVCLGASRGGRASHRVAGGSLRAAAPLHFVGTETDHTVRLLDTQTGREVRVDFADDVTLDQVSCAPWESSTGERLLVGRRQALQGSGTGAVGSGFGLALVDLATRRTIATVPTEILPVSPPCWIPGGGRKILFASGSGSLYRFDFAALDDRSGFLSRNPEPLAWDVPNEATPTMITEPYWLTGEREGDDGLLIATVHRLISREHRLGAGEIWWLRADMESNRIVAGGRLTTPVANRRGTIGGESRAVLSRSDRGETLLVYQVRYEDTPDWQSYIAVVAPGGPDGSPPKGAIPTVIDQEDRAGRLACSQDGRSAFVIQRNWGISPTVRRLPINGGLLARGSSESPSNPSH